MQRKVLDFLYYRKYRAFLHETHLLPCCDTRAYYFIRLLYRCLCCVNDENCICSERTFFVVDIGILPIIRAKSTSSNIIKHKIPNSTPFFKTSDALRSKETHNRRVHIGHSACAKSSEQAPSAGSCSRNCVTGAGTRYARAHSHGNCVALGRERILMY